MKTIRLLLFLALSVPSVHTQAEEVLTLDEVRANALLHSTEAARIDVSIANEFSHMLELDRLSNPQLSAQAGVPVSYQDDRPDTQVQVTLQQTFRLSDFGLRTAVSSLLNDSSKLERNRKLQEFIQRVSLSYFHLWSMRQERQHIIDQLKRSKRIQDLVESSLQQGVASGFDKKIATSNHARLQADKLGIESAVRAAEQKLQKISAIDPGKRTLTRPGFVELHAFDKILTAARASKLSIGKRAELSFALAKEELRLAHRDSFSGISPQLFYSRNEDGIDFVGAGISFSLPFFKRNQSEIEMKTAQLHFERRAREYLLGEEFESELRALFDSVESKIKQAEIYESKVVKGLAESLELAEEAYANAQISLLQLWTLHVEHHQAIDRSTQLWMEVYRGLSELSIITGELEI